MSATFDPGQGWRMEQFGGEVPADVVAFHEDDGSWTYWVREAPVPPLPTAPWTTVRVVWKDDGQSNVVTLTEAGSWMLLSDEKRWQSEDLNGLITSFEVLAEPRAATAKALIDRVTELVDAKDSVFTIGMYDTLVAEFGVES